MQRFKQLTEQEYQQLEVKVRIEMANAHEALHNANKPWTQKDSLFLMKHMNMNNEDLALILGRSPQAIISKKNELMPFVKT